MSGRRPPAAAAPGARGAHGGVAPGAEPAPAEGAVHERLAAETQLRKIAESVPGAICSYRLRPDGSACMPFSTAAIEELYGLSREELARDMGSWAANVHPDDLRRVGDTIAEAARTMSRWHDQFRYRHPTKGLRWIEGWSAPIAEPDGSILWHGYVTDVTERTVAEEERTASEQRATARAAELQVVLDTVPAAVWIARDREGTTIEANRFGAELLRQRRGANVSVTAPPEERPMNFRLMRGGVEVPPDELPLQAGARFGREIRDFELDLVFDDGTVLHLLGNSAPLRDGAGAPHGAVGAFVDITERKQAEARAEALARFPEENPDPVMRLAEDLTVVYANEAARTLLRGLGVEPGRPAPAELAEPARRALRDRARLRGEFTSGGAAYQLSVVPVGSEVNLYAQDVTPRKAAEDALRAADRRKTEFLALLSHELRNPLAPIRNALLLLVRAPPGSDAARRARDVLLRQTEHLTRLVDDLLDLSRISHGKVQLHLARIDAREVVARACEDVRALFDERGVTLRHEEPAEPLWVDADAVRLAQMVGNVLNNALKFTAPGGRVEVVARARGPACEVSVRDDGVGIDAADLERIFDPFTQAERSRHGGQGGMGLGLALARDLALQHGGTLRAASAGHGHGSEFLLALPLAPGAARGAGEPAKDGAPGGLSVLIVEDNEDAGATLAELLALSGHRVRVVTTGRAGIEAASAAVPDVVICDIGLPDLDGHEVLRAVRAGPARDVYAVAITGYAQPEDRERALAAGFDAHLPKPPPLDELEALLERASRRGAPRRP